MPDGRKHYALQGANATYVKKVICTPRELSSALKSSFRIKALPASLKMLVIELNNHINRRNVDVQVGIRAERGVSKLIEGKGHPETHRALVP